MPGVSLCGPRTLVHQTQEVGHFCDVMGGQLLQHPFVPHPLSEGNDDRGCSDLWNGMADVAEALNECTQRLPRLLLHGMEVRLCSGARACSCKVSSELPAQLFPRAYGGLREVHEPRPGRASQGDVKIVCHYVLITLDRMYGGSIDLEEF